jgi:hypothetical protein
LPAFPGAADGGIMLLLAAESGEAVLGEETVSLFLWVESLLPLQDPKNRATIAKETTNNLFIKMISQNN